MKTIHFCLSVRLERIQLDVVCRETDSLSSATRSLHLFLDL